MDNDKDPKMNNTKKRELIEEAVKVKYKPIFRIAGMYYYGGMYGFPKSREKAISLWRQGDELGSKDCRDKLIQAGAE